MSTLLQHISDDFHRRMTLRRRMLAHLDIEIPDDLVIALRPDIKSTLSACRSCGNPDVCEGWIDQSRPGAPAFCRARDAFLRLDSAVAESRPQRLIA